MANVNLHNYKQCQGVSDFAKFVIVIKITLVFALSVFVYFSRFFAGIKLEHGMEETRSHNFTKLDGLH